MKVTLHTVANRLMPAGSFDLIPETVLTNDVIFPGEFNPHGVRLWIMGNQFGPMGAAWASCEQDAFDTLCDEGLTTGLLVEESDVETNEETGEENGIMRLGNAGAPHDSEYSWIAAVDFQPARDWKLLCQFAEARGANSAAL